MTSRFHIVPVVLLWTLALAGLTNDEAWGESNGSKPSDSVNPGASHWAYQAPERPVLPKVDNVEWVLNPMDRFILARLDREGLHASPPEDKARLLRRLYLDLIGLPPEPGKVLSFLNDNSSDAYEKVVDHLLGSKHYGERWALPWLDLARFADSNGFQRDGFRDLWAWRDWVIDAMNADLPFDQFTIEQIAGDLLPNATMEQKIATGFHRCPTVNVEAGTDQEQNRVNQVLDRVNTTATVWLGSSFECGQCHDHKYDPLTQKEYYQLLAYFNNTEIETKFRTAKATAAIDFIGPMMELPMESEQESEKARLEEVVAQKEQAVVEMEMLSKQAPNGHGNGPQEVDKRLKKLRAELKKARQNLKQWMPPQTLVMKEMDEPRKTVVFNRGNFLDRGAPVEPGTPAFLHNPPKGPPNRLTLARWLVSKENPLLARVIVNRWWAEFFGHGIVTTLEDFGLQGRRPTHPQLLDWLAVVFQESGWSRKAIHRLIVTSATYRQATRVNELLAQQDPENQWYARGPRFRLSAELIRDNALAVAGLLSRKQGGPSVKPFQPDGVWVVTGQVDNTYRMSPGEDRYRRGVYTVWRRSAPYPSFVNFDAPSRSACTVQRSRSNTPLQALTLLNDPVYVEAAQTLANRIRQETSGMEWNDQLQHAFLLCLARPVQDFELKRLRSYWETERKRFSLDASAAENVVGKGVELNGQETLAEAAAWCSVAAVFLNLDEFITKG